MLHSLISSIVVAGLLISSSLQAAVPKESITAEFSTGFGFHICRERKEPPPMQDAYRCSQVIPVLKNVEVEMVPQEVNDPEASLYSGTYTDTLEFEHIKANVELFVSFLSYKGKRYAFVDGRIGSNQTHHFAYFRIGADDSFDQLQYSTNYGIPVVYEDRGVPLEFSAIVTVAPKVEEPPKGRSILQRIRADVGGPVR